MSSLQHDHQRFSPEFLKVITQSFNGVVGNNMITISHNKMNLSFNKFEEDDSNIVTNLFSKLVKAFHSIKQKYILHNHNHIKLKLIEKEDRYVIRIHGIIYIPPGKILNLLVLILWYFIRYKTGKKPSQSLEGQKLTNDWKIEEKSLRQSINSSPRHLITDYNPEPCHLCGTMTNSINEFEYYHTQSLSYKVRTRVCTKHRTKLI